MNVDFADVSRAQITIRLVPEGVGGAGVVGGLSREGRGRLDVAIAC